MKKRFFILSVVLFGSINFLSAQITFQKTFNGSGYSWGSDIHQTTDGGYIISGTYEILGFGFLPCLIKTDAYGDTLWTKIGIGGRSVQQTTDGGYICFGDGIVKTDANGNQLWAKSYHLPAYSSGPTCFQQTVDGGYIMAGSVQSTVASSTADVYLFKTDSNGNCLWSKTFGGSNEDMASYVQQTNDGGFIIAGSTSSFGTNQKLYLIKTDTIGDLVWSKTVNGSSGGGAFNNAVQQTNDGGYIIAGSTGPFICLVKTNANGDTLWAKAMGNPTSYQARCVQQTSDGGYIITGNGYLGIGPSGASKPILIKTDVNGDLLWIKAFSASVLSGGSGYSVKQTTDGGYIITGSIDGFSPSLPIVYLVKTDSTGNSGCYQVNDFISVSNAAIQVAIPATIVTSPLTNVTNSVITSYGSGGVVNTLCFSVGINEIAKNNNFSVSPNPSLGNFSITLERAIMKGNMEILNTLGDIIYAENILNESEMEVNLKNISRGIYFVKVFDGEKYYCKKIIIEP